jgi:hypothetical protein
VRGDLTNADLLLRGGARAAAVMPPGSAAPGETAGSLARARGHAAVADAIDGHLGAITGWGGAPPKAKWHQKAKKKMLKADDGAGNFLPARYQCIFINPSEVHCVHNRACCWRRSAAKHHRTASRQQRSIQAAWK